MILQVYSVFDKAVGAHMQPFFARSEGEALRMLRQAVNTPDTQFFANPSDYNLCYHGEFSDQTGTFSTDNVTNMIGLTSLVDSVAPDATRFLHPSQMQNPKENF